MNPRKKTRFLIPLSQPRGMRQPSVFKRFFIFALTSFFAPIFFLVGKIYKLCFGWLDKSAARKNQREFAEEIQTQLRFLFRDKEAKIVPNDPDVPFPPSFDGAYVTVETNTIRFQFIRGRGDFTARVSPLSAPTEWEGLELVLATIPSLQ